MLGEASKPCCIPVDQILRRALTRRCLVCVLFVGHACLGEALDQASTNHHPQLGDSRSLGVRLEPSKHARVTSEHGGGEQPRSIIRRDAGAHQRRAQAVATVVELDSRAAVHLPASRPSLSHSPESAASVTSHATQAAARSEDAALLDKTAGNVTASALTSVDDVHQQSEFGQATQDTSIVARAATLMHSIHRADTRSAVEEDLIAKQASNSTNGTSVEVVLPVDFNSPVKSKVVLVIIELLFPLAFCGVDRCYMGSIGLGIGKGLSCGGLCMWFVLDYFIILFNCLSQANEIDMIGIKAQFKQGTDVTTAFVLAIAVVINIIFCGGCAAKTRPRPPAPARRSLTSQEGSIAAAAVNGAGSGAAEPAAGIVETNAAPAAANGAASSPNA